MFSLVGFCSHKKVTFLDLHAFIFSDHMQSYIFYIRFKFAAKGIFSGYMICVFIFLHILNYLTIVESFFDTSRFRAFQAQS